MTDEIVIQPQQILLPKKVYIGDTAELRCTFNSNETVFHQLLLNGTAEITRNAFTEPLDAKDFEILNISFSQTGIDYYQLTVSFKAWKTGYIVFPDLKLRNTLIRFQPISIVSITEQNNYTSLKDAAAPLLLPGTTYKLYGGLVLLLILLIISIRLFIKRDKIRLYFKNKKLIRKYRKNKKKTLKSLAKLTEEQLDDSIFAEHYQHIMRNYLETRFDYPFTKAASSELSQGFQKATNSLASEVKIQAFDDIASTFIRTDYIRYKSGACFLENEKQNLYKIVTAQIEILEGESDD